MIKKIAIFGTIIFSSILLIYCTTDEEKLIGPFGDSDKYISIANFSSEKTLLYSNGDTTIVKIKVLDIDNTPAVGLVVDFSTLIGIITEADTTDSSGTAFATFIAGPEAGENIITADTGVKKHTLLLRVVHYQPKYVELFAESPVLLADGLSSTKIAVTLKDSIGNPMEGVTVRFNTTLGTLKSKIEITSEAGIANTELVSSNEDGTAFVTATSFVTNFIEVEMKKYVPYLLEIVSEDLVLLANGQDSTAIRAIPRDINGNIMPNVPVLFSTTLGTISSEPGTFSNTTNLIVNSGNTGEEAEIYLRSSPDGGTAIILASSYVTSFIEVKMEKYVPFELKLVTQYPILENDGDSRSIITATVKDSLGKPMNNMTVRFNTTLGTLESSIALTDINGIATTTLISSENEGTAFITATSYITSFVEVKFQHDVASVIELSSSTSTILADGLSRAIITATLKNDNGDPMPDVTIQFSTTLGTVSPDLSITDDTGTATTEFIGGTVEGEAEITASANIEKKIRVSVVSFIPTIISLEASENSILADGMSTVDITAIVRNSSSELVSGVSLDFSTTFGSVDDSLVTTNQNGAAAITLTSSGSIIDTSATVKVAITADTSSYETTNIKLRGITSITVMDSAKMADNGIYKAYLRTELLETVNGAQITSGTVVFSPPDGIGEMVPSLVAIDENSRAYSVFNADVLSTDQTDIIITNELSSAPEITDTIKFDIPGAEILINTIDDDVMGDGVGWALVKATLRKSDGNIAIPLTDISWSTTLGTIKGQSVTNTTGEAIDTLRIEGSVNDDTAVTVTAHYGDNVSTSETLNFISPVTQERIILGFEPDTAGHGVIPCDIDTSLASRDVGISASFVSANGHGYDGEMIGFSVVPNYLASICPFGITVGAEGGLTTVMMVYPPQHGGEIVRVWAQSGDTKGSIDVILPKDAEDDVGGG